MHIYTYIAYRSHRWRTSRAYIDAIYTFKVCILDHFACIHVYVLQNVLFVNFLLRSAISVSLVSEVRSVLVLVCQTIHAKIFDSLDSVECLNMHFGLRYYASSGVITLLRRDLRIWYRLSQFFTISIVQSGENFFW